MVTRDEAFPKKYLKAADLGGKAVRAKIESVDWATVGDEMKLVMTFFGGLKPLPLNVTNFDACVAAFGSDQSDDWIDRVIEVCPENVRDLQGKLVPGVRLHAVPPPREPDANVKVAPNARPRSETPPAEPSPPASAYEGLDDQIPDGPPC